MGYYKSLMGFLCFSLIFGYLTKENCYVEKMNIVKNARQTAKTYGYNVENLTYISDKELAGKSAWGSKYRYNTLNQWNGLYTSYDESYDALYVFVLSRTKVNTNANSIDNGYFRIVAKFLDIKYFVFNYFGPN